MMNSDHKNDKNQKNRNQEVINLKNVWVDYHDITVLEYINLFIYEQEFLGIIGPNGGGKTTLLKVILGLVLPSQGEINVLGAKPEEGRKYIGYVPQYCLFDREFPISVEEVVLTGRLSRRRCCQLTNPWPVSIPPYKLDFMNC